MHLKQNGEISPDDVSGSGRAANVVFWEGGGQGRPLLSEEHRWKKTGEILEGEEFGSGGRRRVKGSFKHYSLNSRWEGGERLLWVEKVAFTWDMSFRHGGNPGVGWSPILCYRFSILTLVLSEATGSCMRTSKQRGETRSPECQRQGL